jgi:hypothetical protein
MSMQALDLSFERAGRSLADWLRDLVADDTATRLAAGQALKAIHWGVTNIHLDLRKVDFKSWPDAKQRGERVQEAIRAAVADPAFPTRKFVRRLIALRIAVSDDWLARIERGGIDAPSPAEEGVLKRLAATTAEAQGIEAARRLMRWRCAGVFRRLKRGNPNFKGAEAVTPAGSLAMTVFDALDSVLLADRPGLWRMLAHKLLFLDAARALARIGPAAVEFTGFFLDQLDAEDVRSHYNGAPALGSIGRDDPVVIDALLRRAINGSEKVRTGAILALGHAGPPLAGRLEVALDILHGATYKAELVHAAIWALASVGRVNQHALKRVLELAVPRPPRWLTKVFHPEDRWNATMLERGTAISALHRFPRSADTVVPVLVDAFDNFEEFGRDQEEDGEHARVCRALSAFGAQAVPIIPRLARYLDEVSLRTDGAWSAPNAVCRLVASLGPPAAPCLPALERLRSARARWNENDDGSLDRDEPLDRAILALRGES